MKPLNYLWPTVTLAVSYSNVTKMRLILVFALSPQKRYQKDLSGHWEGKGFQPSF